MPKLDVYNISKLGVNVDKAQPFLEDGELTKAQNAIRDGIGGDGSLRNRPGLVGFNGSPAAGSIQGGVGVPLAYRGTLGSAIHTLYLGKWNTSTQLSLGWHTSTDQFTTDTAVLSGTPANPVTPQNLYTATDFSSRVSWARHACVLNNRIYYAGDNYVLNTASPTIRVFDGTFDEPLARVPGVARAVICMASLNNTIYLTTWDSGRTTTATLVGSVYNLTPDGVLTPLGVAFPVGRLPFALAWAFGRLWCGTNAGSAVGHSTTVEIYWFRPGIDTVWTLDRTVVASDVAVMAMMSYRGALYAGYVNNTAAAALIEKRTALGVWSTADSSAAANWEGYHGYIAMTVFGGNFYALDYGETGGSLLVIRKYDGTTWTTPTTPTNSLLNAYTNFLQDGSTLYAFGSTSPPGGAGVGSSDIGMKTTDGTTWTGLAGTSAVAQGVTPAVGLIVT